MEGLFLRWATPLYRKRERSADDPSQRRLRELILERESPQARKKNSPQLLHPQVYESEFDFLAWPDQPVVDLKRLIHQRLVEMIQITSRVSQQKLMQFRITSESWFHVTRGGGYVRSHNHPQHSWSVIYCVDRGDETPENEHEAGHLVFTDPRGNADMFLDMANSDLRAEYTGFGHRFRPETGDLILFPSYVWHAVEPYRGETPRITVAANFRFNLPG